MGNGLGHDTISGGTVLQHPMSRAVPEAAPRCAREHPAGAVGPSLEGDRRDLRCNSPPPPTGTSPHCHWHGSRLRGEYPTRVALERAGVSLQPGRSGDVRPQGPPGPLSPVGLIP